MGSRYAQTYVLICTKQVCATTSNDFNLYLGGTQFESR
jgi:hypothetical protein